MATTPTRIRPPLTHFKTVPLHVLKRVLERKASRKTTKRPGGPVKRPGTDLT